ncbi:MAG TPA: hypothetical protein VFX16_01020 [Pseudonocardiaceae bacterium]|nr:hypothetical protein [Pseudonocardiaceae bacterium]
MYVLLILLGLAVMVVALVALIRGKVRWAAISSRKIASGVMVGGLALLVTGGLITPAAGQQGGAVAAPAPTTTTDVVVVTTTVAPPPPVTTTVSVAPTTHTRTTTPVPTHTVHTVAPPVSPLTCRASMSDSTPSHNERTDVIVTTGVAGASVTTTAHYKTTTHPESGVAGSNGKADISYDISRATYGFTVDVDVEVTSHGASKSCSTSFTPAA